MVGDKIRLVDIGVPVSGVDEDDVLEQVPVPRAEWGRYGEYELVGNGKQTNRFCGKFVSFVGCLRVDLHDIITLDGESFKGKVYVRKIHNWCNKPSCPVCFKSGWAVREAGRVKGRLEEARKRFGQIEHLVISVPVKDYGLEFPVLRKKAKGILKRRGVLGGVMIFHAFRYSLGKHWYWSPHFHVLGFIAGGYGRCRKCERKWNCLEGCGGFDDRSYKGFLEDGYYVKVFGERKTVFGIAWYQLNHASVRRGVKRFHVATWFGVCSYRKLKVTVEYRKRVCPICQHDVEGVRYHGGCRFVFDRDSPEYECESYEDYVEEWRGLKRIVWDEKPKGRYRN